MRLEELVVKANIELTKEGKDNEQQILDSIYEEFKNNIKNEVKDKPVNVFYVVDYFCRYTNRSKVLNEVVRHLKEEGYYLSGNDVYISYDSYEKYRKSEIRIFVFLFALGLLFMCTYGVHIIINFANLLKY